MCSFLSREKFTHLEKSHAFVHCVTKRSFFAARPPNNNYPPSLRKTVMNIIVYHTPISAIVCKMNAILQWDIDLVIPRQEADLHQTAHVIDVIHKLEELTDVVGNGGCVGVHLSQVLLIDLANP